MEDDHGKGGRAAAHGLSWKGWRAVGLFLYQRMTIVLLVDNRDPNYTLPSTTYFCFCFCFRSQHLDHVAG